ncbi:glycosyltransferase family 2 protein [Leptolyngbya sp. 7M]|uniref:glycosyltransferase family 2 protein n=1 Tax=Leptolyngbya sp. 7M TaxID=2812896 RepID=UPI001B8BFFC2|nr:glycosyltransferase [Leptolyngbya sp. 7M]QYO66642.1 glycosyltransferase [Leptolyngbya sp. 7M]
MRLVNRVFEIYQKFGVAGLFMALRLRVDRLVEQWRFQRIVEREYLNLPTKAEAEFKGPLISVLLPVYNLDAVWLRKCIDSVRSQIYENWELCIADDASTKSHIRPLLDEYRRKDARIRVTYREINGHISAASNSALELASGEFCVLLDHDDELRKDALFWVAKTLVEAPDTAMIYSDDNLIDEKGRRSRPLFKPDFSRDLMYSLNLVTHLSAYRTSILREIGGFRTGFEGSQDYDLALRVIERINETQIRHIPRILYHWRTIPGSVAHSSEAKPYAHENARRALREHLIRVGAEAEVEPSAYNLHRVRYLLPDRKVATVILWGDGAPAFDPMTSDNKVSEVIECATASPLAVQLNEAAERARGEILVFIRRNTHPNTENPVSELCRFALQEAIGAAGGLLTDRSGAVRSGGIVLGGPAAAAIAHFGLPNHQPGNLIRNQVISNYSAVALDAFAIRRQLFSTFGGFSDAFDSPLFLAADLCVRLREAGYRIVSTPHAQFIFPDRKAVGGMSASIKEIKAFKERWPKFAFSDPFCNPNLTNNGKFRIKIR